MDKLDGFGGIQCSVSLRTDFSCRAPVLVALALLECGMKYEDAVQFIRQ